jgi:L-cysteine S-thiosulfotransferase
LIRAPWWSQLRLLAASGFCATAADGLLPYFSVVGDTIPASLTGAAGDPASGRVIVLDRRLGAVSCATPVGFPKSGFKGVGADLSGAGSRWSAGQFRLRPVDATRVNPNTIMPSYYRVDGVTRVGSAWRGKPMLTAAQIEDVVAFLSTLRD